MARGRLTPLGTLGGPNSGVLWPVHDTNGVLVGVSDTAKINHLGESWSCSVFFPAETAQHVCVGFWWWHGQMHALPTFGGPDGFATAANNQGQVVGWAEDTVRDPSCVRPQVLQFRAALWQIGRGAAGRPAQLPPLPGDSATAADAINSRGEVAGISGSCDVAVGAYSARHAVIWRHGRAVRLPTLGVPAWNTPMELNNRGAVAGFVNARTPGASPATPNFRAALWTADGALHILPTLPGFATSEATGINERGQAVGESCPAAPTAADPCHAVLWWRGHAYDVNKLVAGGRGLVLEFAGDISDAGVMTGQAYSPRTGAYLTFRATPAAQSPAGAR